MAACEARKLNGRNKEVKQKVALHDKVKQHFKDTELRIHTNALQKPPMNESLPSLQSIKHGNTNVGTKSFSNDLFKSSYKIKVNGMFCKKIHFIFIQYTWFTLFRKWIKLKYQVWADHYVQYGRIMCIKTNNLFSLYL